MFVEYETVYINEKGTSNRHAAKIRERLVPPETHAIMNKIAVLMTFCLKEKKRTPQ